MNGFGLDVAGSLLLAFWLGYGWAPFTCYYLIEMQNTIILLQSSITVPSKTYMFFILKIFNNKINIFIFLINIFLSFQIFWCANIKNIFFKIKKNIILMYFQVKNTLKRNCNHTLKHTLNLQWKHRGRHPFLLFYFVILTPTQHGFKTRSDPASRLKAGTRPDLKK